jgi:glycine/D-amino acid oxidase-like deaminating enzyme
MSRVVVVGSGIVGAAIAYELSQVDGLEITVVDQQPGPVQATSPTSTGAALGLLMATISKREKGQNLAMRWAGIDWYEREIPALIERTGIPIQFNRQGLLMLQGHDDDLRAWEKLAKVRQAQGRRLDLWKRSQLQAVLPQVGLDGVTAGVMAPSDRQLDPVAATQAMVAAAQALGATFRFGVTAQGVEKPGRVDTLQTTAGPIGCDWLVIAAGLGSMPLTAALGQPLELRPVLGQAVQVRLPEAMGNPAFQPVITRNDVHVMPLTSGRSETIGDGDYWLGATVEFGPEDQDPDDPDPRRFDLNSDRWPQPDPDALAGLMAQATAICPELAEAQLIRQWHGWRPRPHGRPAPVIEPLAGYDNVLLATGHYRNGVLLAPATATAIRQVIAPIVIPEESEPEDLGTGQ